MIRLQHLIALAAACYCPRLVHAQPATQPVTPPEVQQLHGLADKFGRVYRDFQNVTERKQQLEIEVDGLTAKLADAVLTAVPVYADGMTLEAGRTYAVRGAVAVNLKVSDVTLVGVDTVAPGASPAINLLPGSDGARVVRVRFAVPNAAGGTGKLGVKPCVRVSAKGVRVEDCNFAACDTGVEILPGADGVRVLHCRSSDLRASAVYVGGGDNVTVDDCDFPDSATENLLRWSPQLGVIPKGAIVQNCRLGNPGNKAVIELRTVDGALVYRNTLRASTDHAGVGVGRSDPRDGPGSTNVRVIENTVIDGYISADAASADTLIERNVFQWSRVGGNSAITANGKPGSLKNLRIVGNVGYAPAGTVKPFFGLTAKENIAGLDVGPGQGWQAPPTTQPVQ